MTMQNNTEPAPYHLKGAIYGRYSDGANQTDQSLEGQLRDCRRYAKENQIEIVAEYLDPHISGKEAEKRPQFQKMIADSDRHLFDVVIVWKTDRFARNRYDSVRYKERLKRNGVTVRCATEYIPDSAEGIILESMLEGYAEYYSAELSEKIRRGMRESAYKHKVLTRPPLGYRKGENGEYVINEEEAPFVREIFQMYVNGDKYRVIEEKMTQLGVRTRNNNPLNRQNIVKIIGNERYIGVYEYKNGGIREEDAIPAIIDKNLFYAAQERLNAQKHGTYSTRNWGGHAKRTYLLSGLVFCGECGSVMFAETTVRNGGTEAEETHGYYSCRKHRAKKGERCHCRSVPQKILEDKVKESVRKVLLSKGVLKAICTSITEIEEKEDKKPLLKALNQKKKQKEKAIKNMLQAIEDGAYSETVVERLKALEMELYRINQEIEQANISHSDVQENIEYILTKYKPPTEYQEEYWRELIHLFVKSVTCFDDGKVIIRFNLHKHPTPEGPVFYYSNSGCLNRKVSSELKKNVRGAGVGFHQKRKIRT